MNKFLDLPGLQHVLGLVKTKFVQKESGKGLSSNDFTDDEKTKLSTLRTYGVATSEEAGLLSSNNLVKLNAKVDLTGYIKEEDIQSITNTEINQAMGD